MNRTAKTIIIILAILLAAGAAYGLASSSKSDETSSNEPTVTSDTSTQATDDTESDSGDAPVAATITYTGTAFEPSSITVKAGETIEIVNKSSDAVQFDSDPHPAHTDNEELNVEFISPGESKKTTLTEKGTFGFHNHLDPSVTGKVNVE